MPSTPSPTPAVSGLLVLAGVVAFVSLGLAASPVFWRVSTQEEFLQGEVENVSIDATGQILIGPDTDLVYETTAPFLWSVVEDDGALWVGSGNDGKVFLVTSDGTGREVFDADELNVHALTPDGDGGVYAATSPDGAVYRVTRAGTAEVVFDPEEPYIWAVARRAATQTTDEDVLFVATGDPGRIYRVDAEGERDALLRHQSHTHTDARLRRKRQPPGRHGRTGAGCSDQPRGSGIRRPEQSVRRGPVTPTWDGRVLLRRGSGARGKCPDVVGGVVKRHAACHDCVDLGDGDRDSVGQHRRARGPSIHVVIGDQFGLREWRRLPDSERWCLGHRVGIVGRRALRRDTGGL